MNTAHISSTGVKTGNDIAKNQWKDRFVNKTIREVGTVKLNWS